MLVVEDAPVAWGSLWRLCGRIEFRHHGPDAGQPTTVEER
jgi:hypothetical protein